MNDTEIVNCLQKVKEQYPNYPELYNLLNYLFTGHSNSNYESDTFKKITTNNSNSLALEKSNKQNICNTIEKTTNPSLNSLKKLTKEILSYLNDNKLNQSILFYLSGLSFFDLIPIKKNHSLNDINFSLSDEADYFIKISTEGNILYDLIFKPQTFNEQIIIKPISFDNLRTLKVNSDCQNTMKFIQLKINDCELTPKKPKNYFVISSLNVSENINEKNINFDPNFYPNNANTTKNLDVDFDLIFSTTTDKTIICENLSDISIIFKETNGHMIAKNCMFNSIIWRKCSFNKIPYFDDQCKVSQFINIDNSSLKNLKGEALEYSNLASFFSRSGAYLEAQRLHQKFLLAKAEKSDYGFKVLVRLYNFLNQCGNSIKRPMIGWFIIYLINFFLILYSTCNFFYSFKQVTLTMIPLFTTVEKPNIDSLPIYIQITMYISMILSYILLFLTALTIRKILKLRE